MQFQLQKGELVSIDGDARGHSVRCLEGILWLTQQGDPVDHVLRPGRTFTLNRKGRVVVMAGGDSRLQIEPAEPGAYSGRIRCQAHGYAAKA